MTPNLAPLHFDVRAGVAGALIEITLRDAANAVIDFTTGYSSAYLSIAHPDDLDNELGQIALTRAATAPNLTATPTNTTWSTIVTAWGKTLPVGHGTSFRGRVWTVSNDGSNDEWRHPELWFTVHPPKT